MIIPVSTNIITASLRAPDVTPRHLYVAYQYSGLWNANTHFKIVQLMLFLHSISLKKQSFIRRGIEVA